MRAAQPLDWQELQKKQLSQGRAAVCTHRGCLVVPEASAFRCPCHGSRFEAYGTVTKGPATRPLAHYAIARTDAGRLIVDKSKRLIPDANDAGAYVPVA